MVTISILSNKRETQTVVYALSLNTNVFILVTFALWFYLFGGESSCKKIRHSVALTVKVIHLEERFGRVEPQYEVDSISPKKS